MARSDLNLIKRERLQVLRVLDQALRQVDTQIESLQRLIKRLRARKTKLPTRGDYEELVGLTESLEEAEDEYVKVLKAGFRIYRTVR